MPKLRTLLGKEVIKFCERHGFVIGQQRGSHVKLIHSASEETHVITVPNYKEIDRGTLHSIIKHLMPFIAEDELQKFFYTGDN